MKKIIALAVLGAFAAPAFADSGNVTIAGNVRAGIQFFNDDAGANGESQHTVDGRGELDFKGTEDLGNGLSTVWLVRTRFALDGTKKDENGSSRDGTLANERAYVGLKGSFGQVVAGKGYDNFGDGKYDTFTIYGNQVFGRSTSSKNMVRYDLPAFGGLTASVQWSAGENKRSGAKADDAISGRVDYDADNWGIGFGAASGHVSDTSGADDTINDVRAKSTSYNLTAAWMPMKELTLAAEYQRDKNTVSEINLGQASAGVAVGDTEKTKKWGLYADYSMDKLGFRAMVDQKKVVGSSTKTRDYSLGVNYNLSKRTYAYAEYLRTKTTDKDAEVRTIFGLKHSF